jgi:hypothetical protein
MKTREKTTTARTAQHINCLLVSYSPAFPTRLVPFCLFLFYHTRSARERVTVRITIHCCHFFLFLKEKGEDDGHVLSFNSHHTFSISFHFTQQYNERVDKDYLSKSQMCDDH